MIEVYSMILDSHTSGCEYYLDRYPYNRPRFSGFPNGCQFHISENELIEIDGKKWCIFHLPEKYKRNWKASHVRNFNNYIFVQLDVAQYRGQLADLSGVIFPGKIKFGSRKKKETILPGALFIGCVFMDDADFDNVIFEDEVMFSDSYFHEQALLWNVCYKSEAHFNNANLGPNVHLGSSVFNNHAYFQGVEFPGMCWCSEVVFKGRAWFQQAILGWGANFKDCVFHGEADFSAQLVAANEKSHSFQRISFTGSHFCNRADFGNRVFL